MGMPAIVLSVVAVLALAGCSPIPHEQSVSEFFRCAGGSPDIVKKGC